MVNQSSDTRKRLELEILVLWLPCNLLSSVVFFSQTTIVFSDTTKNWSAQRTLFSPIAMHLRNVTLRGCPRRETWSHVQLRAPVENPVF